MKSIKKIYVVTETREDNWSVPGDWDNDDNYYEKNIGFFDSFEAAEKSLGKWISRWKNKDGVLSAKRTKKKKGVVSIKPEDKPEGFYGDEYENYIFEITFTRTIHTETLLGL